MRSTYCAYLFLLLMFSAFACSNETESSANHEISEDNVFKEYDNAIDKAKELEKLMQDTAKQHAKEIDRQGG